MNEIPAKLPVELPADLAERVQALREKPCRAGHDRGDAYVEIDHRRNTMRLRCRECHRMVLRRSHARRLAAKAEVIGDFLDDRS